MNPSKERINRAGDALREFWVGQRLADPDVELLSTWSLRIVRRTPIH